jgi:molybdate transport system substrate-binding protein
MHSSPLRKLRAIWLLPLLLVASPARAIDSITIIADSNMSLAVSALARSYALENQVVVNTSFTTQDVQENQITEGAAADILITPRANWIEDLKLRGLVDTNSKTVVARGRLALVGPEDVPIEMDQSQVFPSTAIIQKLNWEPGFVIGYPQQLVEGIYSLEAMRNLGASEDMEPYLLYVKNLEQMMNMVQEQKNFGMFFYADVIGRKNMRVLALIPERSHKPIEYYGVVIAGEKMDEARKFLEFLKSKKAATLFSQYGFSV